MEIENQILINSVLNSIFFSRLQAFYVGPAFQGIKMIPPGVHFVFYSSSTRLKSSLNDALLYSWFELKYEKTLS